jgi:hypothetical protein
VCFTVDREFRIIRLAFILRSLQTGMPIDADHRKNLALEGLRGPACLNVVLAHYMFIFLPYAGHFLFPEGKGIQRYGIEYWLAQPFLSVFYNGTYLASHVRKVTKAPSLARSQIIRDL